MLKESDFLKSSKIKILLCIELFLILFGIVGLFGKNEIIVSREQTDVLINEGVSLPAGVYILKLYYRGEGANLGNYGVEVPDAMFKTLLSNNVALYSGITERECEFYLRDNVNNLKAVLDVGENVEIQGLELISTNRGSRVFLFWTVFISLILNSFLMLAMYHRKHPFSTEQQLVMFGVPLFALIASIPSMVDYNIVGADIVFHMQRVEALMQSIVQGELSVRIESLWMGGHGYANSIFYGDTILFIPAFLRVLGMNMDSAYRFFLVVVNFATAWIAYISFSRCFKCSIIGVFGCALYTLAPYRIYNMYNRAAVGEFSAMIFLPLLVWGFYRIYTEDPEKKEYLWNWVIPVVGFSGVIQSHVLSCEMVGVFVALLCIVFWKKTFQRRIFIVLALTVIMTIIINAWFLVPFFDLMLADKYYFGNNANVFVQERGVLPAQIFYTLQAGGSSSRFVENGMVETEPIGLGAPLLLCMAIWLVIRTKYKKNELNEEQKMERIAADVVLALTVLAVYMSTCYFPWDMLSSSHKILATLAGSLQFPTRMTTIITILGVFVACITGRWLLREKKGFFTGKISLILIAVVAIIFTCYQVNDILFTRNSDIRLYTAQNVGSTAVLGAEYLLLDSDIGHMTYHGPVLSDGVTMDAYEKDGLEIVATIQTAEEGYVELPLLCYKGYQAKVAETGEILPIIKGDNCDVRVLLPAGFSGEIIVKYAGMWYWHMAEAISVVAGVGLLIYYLVQKIYLSGNNSDKKFCLLKKRDKSIM